eukprot:3936468-Karenia_brevis.AAC.1
MLQSAKLTPASSVIVTIQVVWHEIVAKAILCFVVRKLPTKAFNARSHVSEITVQFRRAAVYCTCLHFDPVNV